MNVMAEGGVLEGRGQVIDKHGNVKAEFTVTTDPLTQEQIQKLLEANDGNHAQHDNS
tara:strand:+ start:21103 stop:21273 length:171 start_codon:yes stop_codon:yes gene_type:complete